MYFLLLVRIWIPLAPPPKITHARNAFALTCPVEYRGQRFRFECWLMFTEIVKNIVTYQWEVRMVVRPPALCCVLVADAVRELRWLLQRHHARRVRRPLVQSSHHLQIFQLLFRIFALCYCCNKKISSLQHSTGKLSSASDA